MQGRNGGGGGDGRGEAPRLTDLIIKVAVDRLVCPRLVVEVSAALVLRVSHNVSHRLSTTHRRQQHSDNIQAGDKRRSVKGAPKVVSILHSPLT